MKEIPMLFSTEMVEAILDCRKSQTRRIKGLSKINETPHKFIYDGNEINGEHAFEIIDDNGNLTEKYIPVVPACSVGDLIWVREKFETETDGHVRFFANNIEVQNNNAYRQLTKWKPSIHLKKTDARLWLKCTDVRCERLQDISNEDALAEGIKVIENDEAYFDYEFDGKNGSCATPRGSFFSLWSKLNGSESYDSNPWVWVYEFVLLIEKI